MTPEDLSYVKGIAKFLFNPDQIQNLFQLSIEQSRPKDVNPHIQLGDGFELRLCEFANKKGEILKNSYEYCHLYKDGEKVSDSIFRKGGLSQGFVDGYCLLTLYRPVIKTAKTRKERRALQLKGPSFDHGTEVIINEKAEICLESPNICSWLTHLGGRLGVKEKLIYDLDTQTPIAPYYDKLINGKKYVIINHEYGWNSKLGNDRILSTGVYQIEKESAKIFKIDDIVRR